MRRSGRRLAQRIAVHLLVRPLAAWRRCVIVAVTGTCGKTTTSLLLDRLYRAAGYRVATCCTEGVFQDGRQVRTVDSAGPFGVWHALRNFRPDVLIAETARGGLLKFGIGYAACDAAAITFVGDDHLGQEGVHTREQMAAVKGGVAARVRAGGTLALNHDDPLVRGMAARTRALPFWVSATEESSAGRSVFPRAGRLWRRDDDGEQAVAELAQIALLDGGFRPYNLTAVSLAVAVTHGLRSRVPVPDDVVRQVLAEFGLAVGDVPCRNELVRWNDDWLLLGSATHPAAAEQDARLIAGLRQRLGVRHVLMLLTAFEDRQSGPIREMAALFARVADFAWVRPNTLTPPDEVRPLTAALCAGLGALPHEVDGGKPFEELAAASRSRFPGPRLFVIALARYQPGFDADCLREGRS